MSERIAVCSETDLDEGERRIVDAGDREIGVFNVEGDLYALENDCCHLGGPVCTGKISREIVAEYPGPGQRVEERFSNNPTISCPWHGYEYEMETGEHIGVGDPALNTYEVVVEDGTVYVDV